MQYTSIYRTTGLFSSSTTHTVHSCCHRHAHRAAENSRCHLAPLLKLAMMILVVIMVKNVDGVSTRSQPLRTVGWLSQRRFLEADASLSSPPAHVSPSSCSRNERKPRILIAINNPTLLVAAWLCPRPPTAPPMTAPPTGGQSGFESELHTRTNLACCLNLIY